MTHSNDALQQNSWYSDGIVNQEKDISGGKVMPAKTLREIWQLMVLVFF